MKGGDTVTVSEGSYSERINVTTSGSTNNPLTIRAEGQVISQGFTVKANNIVIDGFTITNKNTSTSSGAGVYIDGSHNIVSNNYIHDLYNEGVFLDGGSGRDSSSTSNNLILDNTMVKVRMAGVHVEGQDNTIQGNDISHTIEKPPGAPPRDGDDADGIRYFGSGHLIKGNYIHDISLDDPGNENPHIDCFQTWGPAFDITFDSNYCINDNENEQGFMLQELYGDPVHNLTFINNVIYAWKIFQHEDAENSLIANNTFVSLGTPGTIGFILSNSSEVIVVNNILYNFNGYYYFSDSQNTNVTLDYNIIFKPDGNTTRDYPLLDNDKIIDPLFVNPSERNYHLKENSPAIDAGTNSINIPLDHNGVPRPLGEAPDIGAFEYGTPQVSPTTAITSSPTTTSQCDVVGDLDCSGRVNALDLTILLKNFGSNNADADLDTSGVVNALDISILLQNFGL